MASKNGVVAQWTLNGKTLQSLSEIVATSFLAISSISPTNNIRPLYNFLST